MKYIDVSYDIKRKIENKIYEEGDKLPTEQELCHEYNCSKITIKKALTLLTDQGLIYRLRGSGTFIKKNNLIEQQYIRDHFSGFTNTNGQYYNVTTKVNLLSSSLPSPIVSNILGIPINEYIYEFERVRCLNNTPSSLEYSYVPIKFVPGLTEKTLEGSFFDFVKITTKCKISSKHTSVSIIESNEHIAKHLKIKKGEKVVFSEEIQYLSSGEIFSYCTNYMVCENFKAYNIYTNNDK